MKFFFCAALLIFGLGASASTFVGNGGNAGDVELIVTNSQIQKALGEISNPVDNDNIAKLCVCHEDFQGKPSCELLNKLNAEQVGFCARYIQEKAPSLSQILSKRELIRYSWSNDSMEVQEGAGLRDADAVTDFQNSSITIRQERFLSMNDVDRVFLLGHELFHLTTADGKPLSDEGPIGPFSGRDGARQLINAMASAIVMQVHSQDLFDKYRGAVRRSKSFKNRWISLDVVSLSTQKDAPNAYYIAQHTGGRVGFRYQFTNEWGVMGEYANLKGEKDILSSIKGEESKNILSLGLAYRWMPFHNPLNFAGQSHFIFRGKADMIQAKYKLYDPYVEVKDVASGTGFTFDFNYFIPIVKGFWAQAGVGYSAQNFRFEKIDVEYKTSGISLNTGVSYGF